MQKRENENQKGAQKLAPYDVMMWRNQKVNVWKWEEKEKM